MAQPSAGSLRSRQIAVLPDTGDAGDHDCAISGAAALGTAPEGSICGTMPLFSFVDQAASGPIVASRA